MTRSETSHSHRSETSYSHRSAGGPRDRFETRLSHRSGARARCSSSSRARDDLWGCAVHCEACVDCTLAGVEGGEGGEGSLPGGREGGRSQQGALPAVGREGRVPVLALGAPVLHRVVYWPVGEVVLDTAHCTDTFTKPWYVLQSSLYCPLLHCSVLQPVFWHQGTAVYFTAVTCV